MKPDVLTIAVTVFVVGILISSLGLTKNLNKPNHMVPSSALHQGIEQLRHH
jgi:hypothetical protein